jgi:NAD(P)H-flavin reductase
MKRMLNPHLPQSARIVTRQQNTPTIFTLDLEFTDPAVQKAYVFAPGQFNMLYLPHVGEVAISIVSDPQRDTLYSHTIRALGRVTRGLAQCQQGDFIGVRGPYGQPWPLAKTKNKDIIIVTGGLGCAPVVAVINYIMARRWQFGRLTICQGVKHVDDHIFGQAYAKWRKMPNTGVYLAADQGGPQWPWYQGRVLDLLKQVSLDTDNSLAMLCGPEIMMGLTAEYLVSQGLTDEQVYLSMERNMQCALGQCGHCQIAGSFVCKNGPVYAYAAIKDFLGQPGF